MSATEVDLRDYRPFSLRQTHYLREIVPESLVRNGSLVEIHHFSAIEVNSGVAR